MTKPKRFELKLREQNIPDEVLLEDLRKVASMLGADSVSGPSYDSNGKFHSTTLSNRFGGWNKALDQAGLRISFEIEVTDEQLFNNLITVWERLGRQPGRRDMRPPSAYSERRYMTRWGSWNKALQEFVKWANDPVGKQGADVTSEEITSGEMSLDNIIDDQASEAQFVHRTSRTINQRLRFRILLRDGFTCQACGRSPLKERGVPDLEVDHILAWTKNGETVEENLQTLCRVCNAGKSNIDL